MVNEPRAESFGQSAPQLQDELEAVVLQANHCTLVLTCYLPTASNALLCPELRANREVLTSIHCALEVGIEFESTTM